MEVSGSCTLCMMYRCSNRARNTARTSKKGDEGGERQRANSHKRSNVDLGLPKTQARPESHSEGGGEEGLHFWRKSELKRPSEGSPTYRRRTHFHPVWGQSQSQILRLPASQSPLPSALPAIHRGRTQTTAEGREDHKHAHRLPA